jgi:hypothetical protein
MTKCMILVKANPDHIIQLRKAVKPDCDNWRNVQELLEEIICDDFIDEVGLKKSQE